jgi:hypothetical protein
MSITANHHLHDEDVPTVVNLSREHGQPLWVLRSGELSILSTPELLAAWLANATRQVLELTEESVPW